MDKMRSCPNCDSPVINKTSYKQNMKAIQYFFDHVDATDEDQKEYLRGLIKKYGPRCFFCNLERDSESDCSQIWDAVADAKYQRHEKALSIVKASRVRLMNEAEPRKKEVTQGTSTTKKLKTFPNDATASSMEAEPVSALKLDYDQAARTAALQKVQQE